VALPSDLRTGIWLALGTALALTVGLIAWLIPDQPPAAGSYSTLFWSDCDFLGQGIADRQFELWLHSTETMTLTRISHASLQNRDTKGLWISADGRKIVFHSDSDFHNEGIIDEQFEVWLCDVQTRDLTRITHAVPLGRVGPDPTESRHSWSPTLNADGTAIAFYSDSDFLHQGIPFRQFEIWLFETDTMSLTRATHASPPYRASYTPHISDDGKRIVFYSEADFHGEGIPIEQYEVWAYDVEAGELTRITRASGPDRDSVGPRISGDGTRVVFYSDSDFLNEGIPDGQFEIWLYDMETAQLTRVTRASGDDRYSRKPSINRDGSRIAFESNSDFLGQGIKYFQHEIWLCEMPHAANGDDPMPMPLTRVTTISNDFRDSYEACISPDGRKIAFHSDSDFHNQGILFRLFEIWLYDVETKDLTRLTTSSGLDRASSDPVVVGPTRSRSQGINR
jgi:Tol biopolymer transport system component